MLKALLEKRGRLAKRLSEIQATETLTAELRTEASTLTTDLTAIGQQIEERKAMQATIDSAAAPVNFRMPDGTNSTDADPVISVRSMPRDLSVFTSKRFGDVKTAGEKAFEAGQCLLAIHRNAAAADWCRRHGIEVRTLTENDNASAGSLVPSPLASTIIELITEYGVMRRECGREIMSSDVLTISKRTGGVTGYWVAEAGSITPSNQTYKPVTITAKKLAALVRYSSEINEDAIVSMADKIMLEIGVAFAYAEDNAIINGTGTSSTGGIVGLISAASTTATLPTLADHDEYDEITDADICYGIGKLASYTRSPKIYTSRLFQNNVFTRLARAAGGATVGEFSSLGLVQQYGGLPIVVCEAFPVATGVSAPFCIVGNLSQAVAWGDRRNVTFKRLVELYAATDEEAVVGTERFGAVVHDVGSASITPGAYAVLTTHS
jgi:HK97 family phage major capsid protein